MFSVFTSTNKKNTNSPVVTSGLTLFLDGRKTASYSGSGTAWYDLSGNENHCTLVNSPTFSKNTKNEGFFTFNNASSQRATVSGTPLNTSNYTKFVWFKFSLNANDNNILSYDDGTSTGHYMLISSSNKLRCGHTSWTGYPSIYQSTASFFPSSWYCVALTFNTTDGMKLYINGVLDSSYNSQLTEPANGGIRIGSYSNGGNTLAGSIGKVMVYNRSLSADEVNRNYKATKIFYL